MTALPRFGRLIRQGSSGLLSLSAALAPALAAAAPTSIEIWYDLHGASAAAFTEFVGRFNASQEEVRIETVFKGTDPADAHTEGDASAALLKAWRARQPLPVLVQVGDDRGEAVLAAKGVVRSIDGALPAATIKSMLPQAVALANGARGETFGFPFEVAVPLFFYNRDAYRKAGLDADAPPATWRDLQAQLLALRQPATGVRCGYTTSDQAWIHVENLGAWHGENIAVARPNGTSGPLTFNGLLHVRHMALMMSWLKSQLFTYTGRGKDGDARFASGECATLSAASTALARVSTDARFSWAVAPMPYHEEGMAKAVGSIAGGSALWLTAGRKPAEVEAAARFLTWFASAPIAGEWHRRTGSLPLTAAAYQDTLASGYYDRVPGLGPAMRTLVDGEAAVRRVRAPLRMPNHERVREVIDAQLEAVWNGSKPAKQGLDDAVRLGNLAMRDPRGELRREAAPARVPVRANRANRADRADRAPARVSTTTASSAGHPAGSASARG